MVVLERMCAVSVDVDTVSKVLEAYGLRAVRNSDPTFGKVLPRFLKYFREKKIKATFFIIGSCLERKENIRMVQELYSQGHEIANHSYSHPPRFSCLKAREKEKEITLAEKIIRESTGERPRGFRAPSWDIDRETMLILEKKKYLYDSSIMPSCFLLIMRYYLKLLHKSGETLHLIGKPEYSFAPRLPYHPSEDAIWKRGAMKITEIPITTTPIARVPFFGTAIFSAPISLELLYPFVKSSMQLNFQLHAVELFDPERDVPKDCLGGLRHMPTLMPIDRKIRLYERVFGKLQKDFELVTLKEFSEKLPLPP